MKKMHFVISTGVAVCLLFLSCSKENTNTESTTNSLQANKPGDVRINPREGIVFTMTNDASQNAILAFEQNSNGNLTFVGSTPAGGTGTGSPLGAQGAIVHNFAESFLFAVNAGSNTVSSF